MDEGQVIRLCPKVLAGPRRELQLLLMAFTLALIVSPFASPVRSCILFMGIEQLRYFTTNLYAPLHSANYTYSSLPLVFLRK